MSGNEDVDASQQVAGIASLDLDSLDQLISRSQACSDPDAGLLLTHALIRKVEILGRTGRAAEAAACLIEIPDRASLHRLPEGDRLAARVAYETVVVNVALGSSETVMTTIRQLDTQFAAATEPRELHLLGSTLLMCGEVMAESGALQDALVVDRTVQARLLRQRHPKLVTLGVRAQINVSNVLARLGLLDESMAAIQSIDEHGEAALEALSQLLAQAPKEEPDAASAAWGAVYLLLTAEVLEGLGRHDESQAALTEVIEQYGDSGQPLVEMVVAAARETWDGHRES
jgi:tetratricopeptide (TPR) repeat protein